MEYRVDVGIKKYGKKGENTYSGHFWVMYTFKVYRYTLPEPKVYRYTLGVYRYT